MKFEIHFNNIKISRFQGWAEKKYPHIGLNSPVFPWGVPINRHWGWYRRQKYEV